MKRLEKKKDILFVIAGLVPAIQKTLAVDLDHRDKPGDDSLRAERLLQSPERLWKLST